MDRQTDRQIERQTDFLLLCNKDLPFSCDDKKNWTNKNSQKYNTPDYNLDDFFSLQLYLLTKTRMTTSQRKEAQLNTKQFIVPNKK